MDDYQEITRQFALIFEFIKEHNMNPRVALELKKVVRKFYNNRNKKRYTQRIVAPVENVVS